MATLPTGPWLAPKRLNLGNCGQRPKQIVLSLNIYNALVSYVMIAVIKKAIRQIYHWIVQHEHTTVALVAIVAAGIFGFVKLADEVSEGDSKKFDELILLAMREPDNLADPIGPEWVEEMARDITALGSVIVLSIVTSVTVGYLWLTKQHWVALFVMGAIVSGMLISIGLKTTFDRPRPDLVPHATQIYTKSFPSGHSAMSAMVCSSEVNAWSTAAAKV